MSINRVNISGNLTRDPELRQTAGGMQVLGFGVAVNDRRKNQQTGEWEDHPNYIDCTIFGQRALSLSNILHKGGKVAIEGKLRWSQWQDQQTGQKRSKVEVIVDELELMQQSTNGQNQAPSRNQQPSYIPQPAPQPAYQQPQYAPPQPQYAPPQPAQAAPPMSQPPMPQQSSQQGYYDEDIPF